VATYLLPLLNTHSLPDSAGDVYFEPSNVNLNSNDRYSHAVVAFTSQSARRGFYGKFRVPQNYVGTPKVEIEWVTTATTGDVAWDIDYTAIADGESYDPSADQQSATVTDTAAGTARLLNRATITLTAANFAAGDEVQFYLVRDAADAADTLAATAWLVGLYYSYTDV
jgi:hypothetical protein